MKVQHHKYVLTPSGAYQVIVETGDDTSPLAQAIEAKAAENPGRVIVGTELDGEIKHVDVLEGLT